MEHRLESKCLRCVHQCFGGWQIEHPVFSQCPKDDTIDTLCDQPDVETHRIDVLACVTKSPGARAYQNGDRDTRAGKRIGDTRHYAGRRCKATKLRSTANFDTANAGFCGRKRIIDAVYHDFNLDHCRSIHVRMPLFPASRSFP